ncbi:hypothetical protein A200_05927 [Parascardovia denticolens IPLA 20019]|uniref:MDR family MFS transporter n=1 Tax=Parascardovia denticolens TaxID=78258 RepID=UPI000266BB05|nr:MDR family MFS transporter [Parascardovia denticolens]EIT88091.1 hypothetical protein A200_05927 [Parascardovia denticolens IPLA 20019]
MTNQSGGGRKRAVSAGEGRPSTFQRLAKPLDPAKAYTGGKLTRPAFISLATLTFITFLGNFTQLQLSAALPTIVNEFGINVTTGQWMTSIFQLVMGVMVPLTAFLTRRFSARQIVLSSMVIFIIGSVLSWLGPTFGLVLLGRTLEAMGTGVMWPVLQITVFTLFPLSRRGLAMGTVGVAMAVAPALGPTFGGWQTDSHGWRSIFFGLALVGLLALVLGFFALRNIGENDKEARADFFSVGLSVFGFGGLMFGFTNIESYPFLHPLVWAPMLIGLVGIVWFVLRQLAMARRFKLATQKGKGGAEPPLLNLGVLKNRYFRTGTIVASLSFFAFSSITVIIPLYIQNDRGFSATMSGLIMLPGAFGQCIAQFLGGRMLDRFGARPVALVGTSILFIGTVMMSMIDMNTWIWWVSICQFTRQIGMGFTLMPVTTWSLNCLEPDEVSAGSAVTNTARQIAGAVGAPILVILMALFQRLRLQSLGGSRSLVIVSSVFAVEWVLRISALIALIMVLMVLFGVKGEGAGSSHDLARRAIVRARREMSGFQHHHDHHVIQ